MNELGKKEIPFLFILDYYLKSPLIIPLNEVDHTKIQYNINGVTNSSQNIPKPLGRFDFEVFPVSKSRYIDAFNLVQKHIQHGDSFLLNLTMPSKIKTNLSLMEIYNHTEAKYKIWFKNNFVVFSPEIFIRTKDGMISSYPMKGTIDATLPNAENNLLNNDKELAEHFTIVDLIRNDLSMVSKNVRVKRFRYIDKVETNRGSLLQMSSEIVGELPDNYQSQIGEIIISMLPAGSISGAPKKKTLEIIKEAENYDRGYYTGICGIFDGRDIDSGVMIRYIEETEDGLTYKSGGGITFQSNVDEEYEELIHKIYIPVVK